MLPDLLRPGLLVVFIGTSVSTTSARRGHYYAHPTNKFWELLAATGLAGDKQLVADDDEQLTDLGVGLTDLVKERAESSDARLHVADFDVAAFVARVDACRPRVVAFNGGEACSAVARHLRASKPPTGPIEWMVAGARVYRLPSSSGSAAMGTHVKQRAWAEFGGWARRLVE
jgi:TDG/mug DNA glycosylase family protein